MQFQKIIEFRDREWNELGQNFKSVRACYKLTGTSIWCHTLYSMQQRQCASLWLSSYIQHHCNAVKKSEIAWDWKFLTTLEKKRFLHKGRVYMFTLYVWCVSLKISRLNIISVRYSPKISFRDGFRHVYSLKVMRQIL